MQRTLVLIYGIISYAVFFVTFCYAVLFMQNMLVPKSIDSGDVGPALTAALINVPLMALFAIQHMIMARPWFKKWITQYIPAAAERSTFVLVASVLLILIMWLWQPIPDVLWHLEQPVLRALVFAISFAGFGIVLFASFLIDHFDLFGLRQVVLNFMGKPYTHKPFVERSLYKYVRHPLMVGFLIGFWAAPTMTYGHLLFAAVITGYVVVGVMVEERDLVRFLGSDYLEYRKRTPKFIPRFSRRVKPEAPSAAQA